MTPLLLALRTVYGAALLLMPTRELAVLVRAPIDRRTRLVARLLGARELLQVALIRRNPSPRRQLAGTAVDALHATSMVALAAVDRGRRSLALHNAATSTAFGLAGAAAARVRNPGR